MAALVRHVALVSESNRIKMKDLMTVSAALQKKAARDLSPIWEITATVDPFAKLADVPDGYWPMIIRTTFVKLAQPASTWTGMVSRSRSYPRQLASMNGR